MAKAPSRITTVPVATDDTVLAVRQGLGFGWLASLGVIILSGTDSTRFLQSQTTNDIAKLSVGSGCWSASVDRQGKIQGIYYVWRQAEETYHLLLEKAPIPGLIAHLEKFHILEPFTIRDASAEFGICTVIGPKADEIKPIEHYPSHQTDRFGLPGFEWLIPVEEVSKAQAWLDTLEGIPLSETLLETLRIENGLPKFGPDMDNTTLLPETGLQQRLVSYDKGCYLGQEVIARVKTYGAVQKALVGLTLEPGMSLPQADSPVVIDGKTIGIFKSSVYSPTLQSPIALAYLNKMHRNPGQVLSLETGQATVTPLPFVKNASVTSIEPAQAKRKMAEGLQRFSTGQDDAAILSLQEAIALDPMLCDAYEALGVILGRHDRIDEAIECMHRLLEIAPEHVLAHTNLSIFWLKKGDKDKAEEEKAKATVAGMRQAAKASGLDFAKLEADREAAKAAQIKQLEERIELFKQALKFSPDDPLGNFGIGSCYLELGQYQQAIGPFEKTLAAQPNHTVAYLSLGKSLEGVGENQRAKAIYEKGMGIASARGDMMPLNEMQQRLQKLN